MKSLHIFAIIVFATAIIFGVTVFVWSITDYDPLTFKTEPIPIFEQAVQAGQPIVVQFDYCKNVSKPEEVKRSLVCTDIVYELPEPDVDASAPKGCGKVDAVIFIPKETNPGVCHIEYEVTYQVNPLRKILEEFRTTNFEVVLPPGAPVEVVPFEVEEPVEVGLEQQDEENNLKN